MKKRILVPTSPFAPWARTLATSIADLEHPERAELILLHVFTKEEREAAGSNTDLGENPDIDSLAQSQSSILAAQNILSESGFTVTIVGTVADNLGAGIIDVADARDIDCLCLFSRRRSPAGKAVFGSTLQHVLMNATMPVTTVPPDAISSVAIPEDRE